MKAIAIVELPDDAFDKGRWYLDKIYYTEKESLFDEFANDMWELKPLPKEITNYDVRVSHDYDADYAEGWNDCLEEIAGEYNDMGRSN